VQFKVFKNGFLISSPFLPNNLLTQFLSQKANREAINQKRSNQFSDQVVAPDLIFKSESKSRTKKNRKLDSESIRIASTG
jgi:hypothetical protein